MTAPRTLVFDLEVYRDYFLAAFRNVDTGNTRCFEMFDGQPLDIPTLRAIVLGYRLVSFNGTNYDMPILSLAMKGANCAMIKAASDAIIKTDLRYWQLERKFSFKTIEVDHIDLIEVAPGKASLKLYGGRLHCRRMQDLPIEPDDSIGPAERERLREYCANDLQTTIDLYRHLAPQLALRDKMSAEYGIDLRSKSDAQIAEAVIRAGVTRASGYPVERPEVPAGSSFVYRTPAFIRFETDTMRDALAMVESARFLVPDSGKVVMPKELAAAKIRIGDGVYRMGIGGLHSSEQSVAHFSDSDTILVDRDVASYYPAIILSTGLRPSHMGNAFTTTYQSIVARRLAAKRSGDKVTADSLKITINGSFGKFGSKYSALYSPDLLIQTTITGQLALLMLIERLESEGIAVVSANTDGLVIKCPRHLEPMMEIVVMEWEHDTGFDTEATYYRAIYSRDVNNYIALKDGGGFKLKGAYATPGLQKNPANQIAVDAVVLHLLEGRSIDDTIHACDDIRKFVTIRTVKGGAMKDDAYLGRAIRWYYSTRATGAIHYKLNGYTVPRSEGAMPLMELPDSLPNDIDYAWYIAEAQSILADIGATKKD